MRALWRRGGRPAAGRREYSEYELAALTTGLAGFCDHGVGMLDACTACEKLHAVEAERDLAVGEAVKLAERNAELARQVDDVRAMLRASGLVDPGSGDVVGGVQLVLAAHVQSVISYDQAAAGRTEQRQRAEWAEARAASLEDSLRALQGRREGAAAKRWKAQAEEDRRNARAMADLLASYEGRVLAPSENESRSLRLRDVVKEAVEEFLREESAVRS